MKKRFGKIFTALVLGAVAALFAPEARAVYESSEHDRVLIELVNLARAYPRAAINGIGLDPEGVSKNKPALRRVLDSGMKPFAVHPKLNLTAEIHTKNMLKYNHYCRVLPDGLSVEQKALEQGYPAIDVGLSLGNIVFQNFISPEEAVWKVFKSMLTEELNSDDENNLVLFNPSHNEIGVSFLPGEMVFGNQKKNVYLASCFSGYSLSGEVSSLLLERINWLRNRPEYDFNEEILDPGMLSPQTDDTNLDLVGMPPLAEQTGLISAGLDHIYDMEDKLYYDPISPEGKNPVSRAALYGYETSEIYNALAYVEINEDWSARDYASELLKQLVLQEFLCENGPNHVLNRGFSEAGTAVGMVSVKTSSENNTFFLILSAHIANPVIPRQYAVGGAYTVAGNEPGHKYLKGVQGLVVELLDFHEDRVIESSVTGPTGLFQIPVTSGMYKINLLDQNTVIASRPTIMPQGNILVNFRIKETPK